MSHIRGNNSLLVLVAVVMLALTTIRCNILGTLTFRRSAQLRQVVVREDAICCFSPHWHPDGRVYYLQSNMEARDYDGSLHSVRPDGTDDQLVIDGHFDEFAFSANGRYFVLVRSNGKLEVLDTLGMLSTELPTSASAVDVEFALGDTSIYYIARTQDFTEMGLYSILLDGEQDTLLMRLRSLPRRGFDVSSDGNSFICQETLYSLNGGDREYVKNVTGGVRFFGARDTALLYSHEGELFLRDRLSGRTRSLNAKIEYTCLSDWPSWSMDRKSIVFSSTGGGEFILYGIWLLNPSDAGGD